MCYESSRNSYLPYFLDTVGTTVRRLLRMYPRLG